MTGLQSPLARRATLLLRMLLFIRSSLPELLEKKRLIDLHTNVATAVLDHIKVHAGPGSCRQYS